MEEEKMGLNEATEPASIEVPSGNLKKKMEEATGVEGTGVNPNNPSEVQPILTVNQGETVQEEESVELVTFLPKGSQLFVKKPVQVRAVRMEVPFMVSTLEGVMNGNVGDYLIEGIQGELYPCKPDIFLASYRKA